MAKFNPQAVAEFLSETEFVAFDWQVRGLVSAKFGCTEKTAIRWVHRVLNEGFAVRKGNVITLAWYNFILHWALFLTGLFLFLLWNYFQTGIDIEHQIAIMYTNLTKQGKKNGTTEHV